MPRKPARSPSPPITRVQGADLWQSLGFPSERAFQRARQKGWTAVPLYPIPGQGQGVYARSDELARYLADHPPAGDPSMKT